MGGQGAAPCQDGPEWRGRWAIGRLSAVWIAVGPGRGGSPEPSAPALQGGPGAVGLDVLLSLRRPSERVPGRRPPTAGPPRGPGPVVLEGPGPPCSHAASVADGGAPASCPGESGRAGPSRASVRLRHFTAYLPLFGPVTSEPLRDHLIPRRHMQADQRCVAALQDLLHGVRVLIRQAGRWH